MILHNPLDEEAALQRLVEAQEDLDAQVERDAVAREKAGRVIESQEFTSSKREREAA